MNDIDTFRAHRTFSSHTLACWHLSCYGNCECSQGRFFFLLNHNLRSRRSKPMINIILSAKILHSRSCPLLLPLFDLSCSVEEVPCRVGSSQRRTKFHSHWQKAANLNVTSLKGCNTERSRGTPLTAHSWGSVWQDVKHTLTLLGQHGSSHCLKNRFFPLSRIFLLNKKKSN